MDKHEEAVATIAAQVQAFHTRGEKFRIYHGSTNSTRRGKRKRSEVVDTSFLTNVLKVDTLRNVVIVEPNVPMDKLVEATMAHGLIPPVVPEFPGITVGGAVVGTAGESSSFKFGFVDSNVERVQVVLASGNVVYASKDENSDLFFGIPSSFGTLGVLTQIEMRLTLAKKFVALTYHPVYNFAEAVQTTVKFTKDPSIDFLDSIVYSRTKAAIMTGVFTDNESGSRIQQFSRARDQWFYIHAGRSLSTKSEPVTDIIPIADYLFRYDRGAFWTGRFAFKYFVIAPYDRFSRWCLDWFMHTRVMYQALHESGMSNAYVIQDLALPVDGAEPFLEWVDKDLGIYPLWLCPLIQRPTGVMSPRVPVHPQSEQDSDSSSPEKKAEVMLNIGVWGAGPRDREKFIAVNRKLEKTVSDLGGIKWLYAQTYYTETEFWDIYDRQAYDALREKYGAGKMPTVYDKVGIDLEKERKARAEAKGLKKIKMSLKEVWPVRGVYGVWRVVVGREYLLTKDKKKEKKA